MKLLYDTNNFIRTAISDNVCICSEYIAHEGQCLLDHNDLDLIEIGIDDYDGLTAVYFANFDSNVELSDYYNLPQYQFIDNEVVPVTDPVVYQVDPLMWQNFVRKLTDQTNLDLANLTDAELKVIYDNAPQYQQDIIYAQIELNEAGTILQQRVNLTIESIMRTVLEIIYIRDVVKRELTQGEQTAYDAVLTRVHNSNGQFMPFNGNQWYDTYQQYVIDDITAARTLIGNRRYAICGKI